MDFSKVIPLAATIPDVSAQWTISDYRNAVKIRWGIGRNNSKITPGLYKIGNPDSKSDVFVSANYRLSFDLLRKNLNSFNAWILVIDTKGVNVWCAAGKGNFSSENLAESINRTFLKDIVKHQRVIVPQLAAGGVAGYKVKELTGFKVVFGPVRASDIKEFVTSGYKASPEMRTVSFPFYERAKLIPVDLLAGTYKLLAALLIVFFLSGLDRTGFLFTKMIHSGLFPMVNITGGYLAGIVITPMLLPVIPFRAFAIKGALTGFVIIIFLNMYFTVPVIERIASGFIALAIASFMAMNFTGSSTYTSLSGVKIEIKWSVPVQIGLIIIGLLLFITFKLI